MGQCLFGCLGPDARHLRAPQGNEGASSSIKARCSLPWLKSLCHSLNQLRHPSDLIQTLQLPVLNCAPNAPAPGNEIDGFLSSIGPIMPGQVRVPFHWRVKFSVNCSPNAIGPKREPSVEASLPRTLLGKRSCAHPKHTETSVLPIADAAPHPPTSLPCRKLWRLLPPLQCMGMVTTQSSHAQRGGYRRPMHKCLHQSLAGEGCMGN